jgi:hypothetical protein
MRMFSVAMKGSSAMTWDRTTSGHTCSPSAMLSSMVKMTSTAKKPSGRMIRRMAESSNVRSSHWFACVCPAPSGSPITYRARLQTRSERIGFLL